MKTIDVIVPVYAGLGETKRCLESILHYPQVADFELIVIDDQSPEPLLVEFLKELAHTHQITLLSNPQNLGFVGTVNRGMQVHEDRDVILLNNDTEPANDWLDRLVACAYREENIGTVTPFSNNATICSYPGFCQDNALPSGMDVETLDQMFKMINTGESVEIPTAVGFCMYIRRTCLQEVGYFDAEAFGKGYGEENDFCMRAKYKGWKNVLCADVYIYHSGNVSFGDTYSERKLAATNKLNAMHPSYEALVHQHIILNPANALRQRVMLASLLNHSKPLVLFITHNRGGGTERHIQELITQLSSQIEAIIMRPSSDGTGITEIEYQGFLKFYFDIDQELDSLTDFLKTIKVAQIHVHHTMGLHPAIFSLPERLNVSWDFTFHDYYTICPQISLIDMQGRYCGEPEEDGCNACLKKRPAPGNASIVTWRNYSKIFLARADRCFAPSKDAADRLKAYFPNINILTVYHENGLLTKNKIVEIPRKPVERLKVLIIGALSPMKGADLLEETALDAKRRNLPVDFILLGYCYRDVVTTPKSNLTVTGAYQEADLTRLIAKYQPDIAWFPALCPETYNYTLSAALQAGLPIVAPNIGAFRERLYERKHAWIVPWNISERSLNNFFIELKNTVFLGIRLHDQERYTSHTASVNCDFNYSKNFLLKINPDMVKAVTLEQFIDQWKAHLVLVRPMIARINYGALLWLVRLRQLSHFRWLVKRIPQSFQGRLKSWLLRNY
ncbi:MAG: glycosyltransferase [Methylobacter sp.]